MADSSLDFLDVLADGHCRQGLIFVVLEQLAAKMYGDNGEIGSDDRMHTHHGDACVVPKSVDSALGEARQHMQRPPVGRQGLVRGRVYLFRILVQPGYNFPYRIGYFGKNDNVQAPKAAEIPEQVGNGAFAGIPEENAHQKSGVDGSS